MFLVSNNDRFDDDKISLHKIWHFYVIKRITY